MRPLIVQVESGKGDTVIEYAKKSGKNISKWTAKDNNRDIDVVLAFIPNKEVEKYIEDVSKIEEAQITLFPQGVMAMYPPEDDAPEQLKDVQRRSPIEIFLAGLQSIGSWNGFISYAVISSIVVWIGLFTDTSFLLVAAMLIAPFAGPAMNTAIATARGDAHLLKRAMIRYGAAIMITIISCFLLSVFMQQEVATSLMADRSQISSVAVLLALAAGAAGALNLVQSERDSLVSGAAVGMLVAASLAPPVGVVGMAAAIGKWEMVKSGVFLLLLQLIGINLSGSIIFKLFGLNSQGSRYSRGKKKIFTISLIVTIALLIVMMWWQFQSPTELQRSSVSKRAEEEIQKTVKEHEAFYLVEANARFTRADIPSKNTLLCIIYVQKTQQNLIKIDSLKKDLEQKISASIKGNLKDVDPVISVVVL